MTSSQTAPRHRAPEGPELRIATPQDLVRIGRHAEPEWVREFHDPRRDSDPFEEFGFRAIG